MAKRNFNTRYKQLEADVKFALRKAIEKSKVESIHVSEKCIKVDVYDYTELTIINDELTFLDRTGYQYSLYAECSLEDLIDILTKLY